MLIPTIIMGALALIFFFTAYFKGENKHLTGIMLSGNMLLDIFPLLICAFIVAGMVQVLIPKELMIKWVGAESGFRGILIGTVSGGFMVGGPYVSLPLAAGLMKAGASTATMVAFITAWSLWAVSRMPMEIGIMGWEFTMIRLACTFFFPPIAGLIAMMFFTDKI